MNAKIANFIRVVIVVFLFSFSVEKVDAVTCQYGKYYGDKWEPLVKLRIDGWNDFTLSHESSIVGVTDANKLKKCTQSDCEKNGLDYYLSGEDSPCNNGKALFEWLGAKCTAAFTYSVNLYVTEDSYKITQGYCPERIQMCHKTESNSIAATWIKAEDDTVTSFYIYRDGLTKKEVESKVSWFYNSSTHYCMVLNEISIKDEKYITDVEYGDCSTVSDYLYVMRRAKDANGGNCENNDAFTKAYRELSALCDNYSSSTNYTGDNDGTTTAKSCMTECSKLKDHVSDICGYVPSVSVTENCNSIGDRLIAWIFKIINMVRYIVPVLLIILGILDFIKAIASDSEDELKKAGSRFAKRLVASALVFIVPLVLQFILSIFSIPGLDPNNPFCVL